MYKIFVCVKFACQDFRNYKIKKFLYFLKPRRSQQTQLQLIMTLLSLVKMECHKKLFQTGSLR